MHPVCTCYLKSSTWTLQNFHRVEKSHVLTALSEKVHSCSMLGNINQFNIYFFVGNIALIEISIWGGKDCPHGILISFRFLHRRQNHRGRRNLIQKHFDIHMLQFDSFFVQWHSVFCERSMTKTRSKCLDFGCFCKRNFKYETAYDILPRHEITTIFYSCTLLNSLFELLFGSS